MSSPPTGPAMPRSGGRSARPRLALPYAIVTVAGIWAVVTWSKLFTSQDGRSLWAWSGGGEPDHRVLVRDHGDDATAPDASEEPPSDWKDEWMRDWIARQGAWTLDDAKCTTDHASNTTTCVVPKYLPPRAHAPYPVPSRIPKVLFQTWKSNTVGPCAFDAIMSFVKLNPEYEFVFMDNRDAAEFVCRFAPSYATIAAYDMLKYGACRADIWRVLILERYGGIYVDADDRPLMPFQDFIPPNADMVSGPRYTTHENEDSSRFEFCFLAFSPHHVFLRRTLQAIVEETLRVNAAGKWKGCHNVTGPFVYWRTIKPLLHDNGCSFVRADAEALGLTFSKSLETCPNQNSPHPIGRLKIHAKGIGAFIIRKSDDVALERKKEGEIWYRNKASYRDMFRQDVGWLCQEFDEKW